MEGGQIRLIINSETRAEDKCRILEEDFQIKMPQRLEIEVSLMCDLIKGVEEKGIEKGIEKGKYSGLRPRIAIWGCRRKGF